MFRHGFFARLIFMLAIAMGSAAPAHAQWVVFDPANFAESIMTALQTLQSNVNEATQIANQITQIENEVKNLKTLAPATALALLNSDVAAWTQLNQRFKQIQGLGANVGTVVANYNARFPNRNIQGTLSSAAVERQVLQALTQARRSYQGVYQTSGEDMASLPKQVADLQSAVSASQGADGNLDALQAQTLVLAQIATLLMQQNAQAAAFAQAQTDAMAQEALRLDTGTKQSVDAGASYTSVSAQPPTAYLPRLH